jgi:5-methylcytosine-specific restriction endonuclease McrA
MARSLVLNATDEPLSVVSTRRAAVLVLSQKADVVHAGDGWLRSERERLPVPSVVRLRYFVRVPFQRRAALNRRAVFARDDHRCQYCHGPAESIDHVVPRSRGGGHHWENVVAACRPCNVRKRDRYLEDTSMQLRSVPRAPRHLSWLVVTVGEIPEPWAPYVRSPALAG